MRYLIYEAFNTVNGKLYIGLTTRTLEIRRRQHERAAKCGKGSVFGKALRKYGPESFEWSVICECSSKEKMYEMEKLIISLFEKQQLYNVSLGGEHPAFGLRHSEKTKEICGEYGKRRWDGKRASDRYDPSVFELPYKEAAKLGVPKTTYYREVRRRAGQSAPAAIVLQSNA